MRRKLYLIKKVFVEDGLINTDTDIFYTKEERDKEWNRVILSHNNLIIDTYGIDLNDVPENLYYEWDKEFLEFCDKEEAEAHHDYFVKDETMLEVPNEEN